MKPGRLVVFALGYVLGTRAGRARYEAIVAAAQGFATRLEAYADQSGAPGRPAAGDADGGAQHR